MFGGASSVPANYLEYKFYPCISYEQYLETYDENQRYFIESSLMDGETIYSTE